MANLRTEITEIVTGLGMLGYRELDHALGVRPRLVCGVTEAHFDRLEAARADGVNEADFTTAWANGQTFAFSEEGLRGRPPWWLEWKGPHRPPAYEQIPADLRVDHVYLVSCKYGSNILMNAGPSHVFERRLAERRSSKAADWFCDVSPEAYQELWSTCRADVDDMRSLPERAADLQPTHRAAAKQALRGRRWPSPETEAAYRWMAVDVSNRSAERWLATVRDRAEAEQLLWRLLRFAAAPYFVLGAAADGTPLHYRVATPWDFRNRYRFVSFDAWGDAVGQPLVRWRADVVDRESDAARSVEGHIEIRWSHGRFAAMPEAKIRLDTAHHDVPGYVPLALSSNS